MKRLVLLTLAACGPMPMPEVDSGVVEVHDAGVLHAGAPRADDPWADQLVRYVPGAGAGFGQDRLPDVVLGAPRGMGATSGSLDVLSLGNQGLVEVAFTDVEVVDGPGVDFAVFENPFSGFRELGRVSVSDDGLTWRAFSCAADDVDGGFPGCAGVSSVFPLADDAGVGADAVRALGGDQFDLATVGLSHARFVRVEDTGSNRFYGTPSGGFDFDAVGVIRGRRLDGGSW